MPRDAAELIVVAMGLACAGAWTIGRTRGIYFFYCAAAILWRKWDGDQVTESSMGSVGATVSSRIFSGHDDAGEPFAILYGPRGVEWQRGAEAQKWLDVVRRPTEASRADPAVKHGARGSKRSEQDANASLITEGLNAAANLMGVVAQLVLAVSEVLKWWEQRQYRLMDEAKFEEERRVPWTYDMMARWVKAHEEGRHLDLQISHFLGRETAATLGALVENKKMAIPQSMLYDLEQIRAVVGRLRMLLRRQFRALERTEVFNINAVIAKAFDGQDTKTLGLNHAFLRKLASDPAEDWDRLLAANDVKSFESDVRELTRQPAKFAEKVFGLSSEKSDKKQQLLVDGNLPSWSPFVVGALTGAMKLSPTLVGANVLAAAVVYTYEKVTASDASRRDDFRELALFSAEVERTRILHKLWCLLDGMVRRDRGSGILVLEQGGCLTLSASSKTSDQYEILANEELVLLFDRIALPMPAERWLARGAVS